MNRETIIECFYKTRKPIPEMKRYCELYDVYLTTAVLQPSSLEDAGHEKVRFSNSQRDNTSVTNTLSICSALSRMSMDRSVYVDIVSNRKKHNIFLELEDEDPNLKKWHYLDEKEIIRGPFSSAQMNDFFMLNKLQEKSQVKEAYKNDDFIPFKLLIKRYYKKITSDMEEGKKRRPDLKNGTKNFKKGDLLKLPKRQMKENFKNQGRMERVLTQEVRPSNLYFLDDLVDDPDVMELLGGRKDRATTMQ